MGSALLFVGAFAATEVGAQPAKKFELVAKQRDLVIDEGVVLKALTFNETVPGPLLLVNEGDTVEITVRNEDAITHGFSVHAANTQTSLSVGNLPAGETKKLTFKADFPGVFMYHCAPGGHGIMTHTMAGMFGMIVVEPKKKYKLEEQLGKPPDLKVYVIQHEVYSNGRDFFDGKALYVMFNGYNFRYVNEPIPARPGDYVRFYYLNVGPNLISTFHAVGGIWEYIHYQGNPNNVMVGSQSVISGPTDSWVIEWRVPAEGPFTLVSHAFGTQAIKGAIGVLSSKADAPRVREVRSEGNTVSVPASPKRVVAPFEIGSSDLDRPVRFQPGETVQVQIVGNSFWPKVVEVPVGAEVTWVNEDVFDLLEGERTGRHDVVITGGPEEFSSVEMEHADKFTYKFEKAGEYDYVCTIHPYMKAKVRVYK
ncbi:MAG: multicopper oxidase domain-containing protein [Acidobacteria bacterium]|nr:multicopper oxidase domain-containing protein [Acidobacteriota bacterium]